VEPDSPQMTIWRIAWWITEATDTRRISNGYCFFTTTVVTRTRLSVTFVLRCLSRSLIRAPRKPIVVPGATSRLSSIPESIRNAQNVKAFLSGLRRSRSGCIPASLVSLVVLLRSSVFAALILLRRLNL
jgi:hypothetical protein